MNVFTFSGNLGRDAERRYTAGGDSAVSFSVAVKSGFGDKAVTSWIKCNLWGKRGESVMPYLKKGQLVGVSGEFSAREWQDKEGQTKMCNCSAAAHRNKRRRQRSHQGPRLLVTSPTTCLFRTSE